ncbi:MAG: hypothetical protein WAU77_03505 [Solirubrobacteraceae bacterium]
MSILVASRHLGPGRRYLVFAKALALTLGMALALAGCGLGTAMTGTVDRTSSVPSTNPHTGARAGARTVRSGGLTVRLVVEPKLARRGVPVRIVLAAHELGARGAFGYLLRYGDGTTSGSGAIPQFCPSGGLRPASQTWRVAHRYAAKGRYLVSVSVYVNCSDDRVTVTVPVLVG